MFYEFNEPYYALIKGDFINHAEGPVELTSVRVYEENIAKLDGLTDSMKLRSSKGRYVYRDEAFYLFTKCLGDKSFGEAQRIFKAIPINSLVIVDHALL